MLPSLGGDKNPKQWCHEKALKGLLTPNKKQTNNRFNKYTSQSMIWLVTSAYCSGSAFVSCNPLSFWCLAGWSGGFHCAIGAWLQPGKLPAWVPWFLLSRDCCPHHNAWLMNELVEYSSLSLSLTASGHGSRLYLCQLVSHASLRDAEGCDEWVSICSGPN